MKTRRAEQIAAINWRITRLMDEIRMLEREKDELLRRDKEARRTNDT